MDYFIVLSGFVTHWARAASPLMSELVGTTPSAGTGGASAACSWRCGWPWPCPLSLLYLGGNGVMSTHLSLCALLEPWRSPPTRWCPDGLQSWTVAALAPSRLLYPVLYDPFLYERRHLMVIAVVARDHTVLRSRSPVRSGGLRAGAYFNDSAHTALYLWPPAQLADFLLGCVGR